MSAPLRKLPTTTTARGEVRDNWGEKDELHQMPLKPRRIDPRAKYARVIDAYMRGKKIQPFSSK